MNANAKITQWSGPDEAARAAVREKRVAVCTSADARFFPMLDELLASLHDLKLPATWKIAVVDAGMTPPQISALKNAGFLVQEASWLLSVPMPPGTPGWFRGVCARPYVPQLFPGFETYIQMDADACMLDIEGLLDVAIAAEDASQCAIVFEQFSPGGVRIPVNLPNGQMALATISEASIRRAVERCYVQNYGPDYAWCAQEFICNTGMLAMRHDSPNWEVWGDYLSRALVSAPIHKLIEQQSLNLAMLEGVVPVLQMPNTYNWNIATRLPAVRAPTASTRGVLLDPSSGEPIHMFHLTDLKHLNVFDVPKASGGMFALPLRFRKLRAALARVTLM